ncbi:MAG TPA: PIN domain-containing protein [Thermoanaerobaculia bacterium]
MSYLFDTNAISEVFKPRPNPEYVEWLGTVPRDEQYTSTVAIGELYVVAYRSQARKKWFERIREQVIPRMIVLDYDLACAAEYGRIRAHLADAGTPIGDTDVQIAATVIVHGLTLVTANVDHFQRVPSLDLRAFLTGVQVRTLERKSQ